MFDSKIKMVNRECFVEFEVANKIIAELMHVELVEDGLIMDGHGDMYKVGAECLMDDCTPAYELRRTDGRNKIKMPKATVDKLLA